MTRLQDVRAPWRAAIAALALLAFAGVPAVTATLPQETAVATDSQAALRKKILETAEAYATFEWTAGEENVFHGETPSGVRVDTPDVSFHQDGWHTDGRKNHGMPYSWGGFSSIEEFKEGLAAGRYAGNIPASTRAPGSGLAVGLDCSGFVARAWDMPVKQSTRTLGALCYELGDYEELLPGDILNIVNGHVVLFKEWADRQHESMLVYEAGHLQVDEARYTVAERKQRGFVPMRYKPLDARWVEMKLEGAEELDAGEAEGEWIPDAAGVYPELTELKDPLDDAKAMEWASYRVADSFGRMPAETNRTTMVARVTGERVETQTRTDQLGKQLMTGRRVPKDAPVALSLVEFMAFEEPLQDVTLIEGSAEKGEYAIGTRRFAGHRVTCFLESGWNMHGVVRPVTIEIDCVLSDEVGYQGVLEARFVCEIVWEEDDEGNLSVSERELFFALNGFGGM